MMATLLAVQAPNALVLEPGWVGPTVAIALVVIGLAFLAMGIGVFLATRATAVAARKLTGELNQLRQQLEPTITGLNELTRDGRDLATRMRHEVEGLISTSQRIRLDVDRGMKRARRRLTDLDALVEVVQEEVEDTTLDVAARVRSFRTGTSVVGRLRRLLLRGRR